MTSREIQAKIAQLDALQDDESISDDEFDRLEAEIARLYVSLAAAEALEQDRSIKRIARVSPWYHQFLSSFSVGTRVVTNKQSYYLKQVNHGRPFIYAGKIYECDGPNYRAGFSHAVVRPAP